MQSFIKSNARKLFPIKIVERDSRIKRQWPRYKIPISNYPRKSFHTYLRTRFPFRARKAIHVWKIDSYSFDPLLKSYQIVYPETSRVPFEGRRIISFFGCWTFQSGGRNEISPILLPTFNFRHLGNFSRKRVKVLSLRGGPRSSVANFPRIYSRGDIKSVEDACEDIQWSWRTSWHVQHLPPPSPPLPPPCCTYR